MKLCDPVLSSLSAPAKFSINRQSSRGSGVGFQHQCSDAAVTHTGSRNDMFRDFEANEPNRKEENRTPAMAFFISYDEWPQN